MATPEVGALRTELKDLKHQMAVLSEVLQKRQVKDELIAQR
jgi:hypothetical protein